MKQQVVSCQPLPDGKMRFGLKCGHSVTACFPFIMENIFDCQLCNTIEPGSPQATPPPGGWPQTMEPIRDDSDDWKNQ